MYNDAGFSNRFYHTEKEGKRDYQNNKRKKMRGLLAVPLRHNMIPDRQENDSRQAGIVPYQIYSRLPTGAVDYLSGLGRNLCSLSIFRLTITVARRVVHAAA